MQPVQLSSLLDAVQALYTQYEQLLKLLGALGIPAGIFWLIREYRARVQVEVRDLAFPTLGQDVVRTVSFRAINLSDKLTAFRPAFTMTGINPEGAKQVYKFTFTWIAGNPPLDLRLPPHEEKVFLAMHNQLQNSVMYFLWYTDFALSLTRGGTVHVRLLNADKEHVPYWRFLYERPVFRLRALKRWF